MCAVPKRTLCMLMFQGFYQCISLILSSQVSKTAINTDIVIVFVSHILLISIVRSLYFDSFPVTLLEVLGSDCTAIFMRCIPSLSCAWWWYLTYSLLPLGWPGWARPIDQSSSSFCLSTSAFMWCIFSMFSIFLVSVCSILMLHRLKFIILK